MGKKRQARKRLAKQRHLERETSRKTSSSEWFVVNVIIIVAFLILHGISSNEDSGTDSYYGAQNGLFILSCLAILCFVAGKNLNVQIFESAKKATQASKAVGKRDLGNILLGVTYVISFATLFVIDLSFLPNYGLRISGVVAVNIFVLLRNLFYARKGDI